MTDDQPWYVDVVVPALLRHARTVYALAMRAALDEAGYNDVPRNGLYVIGGMALRNHTERGEDMQLSQLIAELRISKQAAGQLVDTLVTRGYLTRTVDPSDRRKLSVALTERGRDAAEVQRAARERIDAELEAALGADGVAALRRGLGVLIELGN